MLKNIIKKILSFLNNDECLFVGSTDLLPPPLSKEEEIEYVKKSMLGDVDARNILIEHNLRLVVFLAKKYDSGNDLEDLVSIGSIGLIKGINTYKLDKNIKLATYVSRCINNEILMFLRKNKKRNADISLEDALNYDAEGNSLSLEDVLGTEDDIVSKKFEEKLEKKYLIQELNNLNEREKQIMKLRYGLNNSHEYTQKEVANMLNISQSYISRIEKKIINNIKERINI